MKKDFFLVSAIKMKVEIIKFVYVLGNERKRTIQKAKLFMTKTLKNIYQCQLTEQHQSLTENSA
jgi:hypothetical protein